MTRRSGSVVDAHHRVRRVEGHPRLARRPRGTVGRLPAAITIRSAVSATSGPSTCSSRGTGEPGVALVERDVAAAVGAVVPAGRRRSGRSGRTRGRGCRSSAPCRRSRRSPDGRPWRTARARSAGCTNIFVGMQPTLRQVPPNVPCSTSATSRCSNRASRNELPEPEPMTIRSWWRTDNEARFCAHMDGTVRRAIGAGPDLTTAALHGLLRLRVDVFVVEQRVRLRRAGRPRPRTRHRPLRGSGRRAAPLAYLRLLTEPGGERRIGRVCTAASARGRGLGRRLLAAALQEVGDAPCVLDAQEHLTGLYGGFGFVPSGPGYDWDGVPHVPMRRPSGRARPITARARQERGHGDMSDDAGRGRLGRRAGARQRGAGRPDGGPGDRPRHADARPGRRPEPRGRSRPRPSGPVRLRPAAHRPGRPALPQRAGCGSG